MMRATAMVGAYEGLVAMTVVRAVVRTSTRANYDSCQDNCEREQVDATARTKVGSGS